MPKDIELNGVRTSKREKGESKRFIQVATSNVDFTHKGVKGSVTIGHQVIVSIHDHGGNVGTQFKVDVKDLVSSAVDNYLKNKDAEN